MITIISGLIGFAIVFVLGVRLIFNYRKSSTLSDIEKEDRSAKDLIYFIFAILCITISIIFDDSKFTKTDIVTVVQFLFISFVTYSIIRSYNKSKKP